MAEVKGEKSRKVVVTDPNEAVGAIVEAKGVPGLEEPLKCVYRRSPLTVFISKEFETTWVPAQAQAVASSTNIASVGDVRRSA